MTIDFAIGLFTGITLVGVGFAFGLLVGGGGGDRLGPPLRDGSWRSEPMFRSESITTYRDDEPPDDEPSPALRTAAHHVIDAWRRLPVEPDPDPDHLRDAIEDMVRALGDDAS